MYEPLTDEQLGIYRDNPTPSERVLLAEVEYWKARCQELEVQREVAIVDYQTVVADAEEAYARLAEQQAVDDAIMECAVGRPGPLSDSDVCGVIEELRYNYIALLSAVRDLLEALDDWPAAQLRLEAEISAAREALENCNALC